MAEETGTYTIKTIEGTGDKAQYWRIADSLVRGSRLYRHLCVKIYRAHAAKGLNRYHRIRNRAMYKDLMKEFKQFEKDANKILKKQELQIQKLQKEVATVRALNEKRKNIIRVQRNRMRLVRLKEAKTEKQMKEVKFVESFLGKNQKWDNVYGDKQKAELFLRSIIGYEEQVSKGETDFFEIILLAIGTQLEAFSRKQVAERFTGKVSKYFLREVKRLMDKGYVKKFNRRDYYYLTQEGKDKFKKTLSLIYSIQYGHYWKGIFTNKKPIHGNSAVRKLSTVTDSGS